jgi:hypothetical protein
MPDGTWKLMRGVDPKLVDISRQVLIRKEQNIPKAPPSPPETFDSLLAKESVIAPDFQMLMQKITSAVASGKLKQPDVVKACNSVGIASLPLVSTQPDLIPQLMIAIDLMIS